MILGTLLTKLDGTLRGNILFAKTKSRNMILDMWDFPFAPLCEHWYQVLKLAHITSEHLENFQTWAVSI